ncbi:agmatinase [Polymorphum gilvum]|uniref:Agmatinase, putative n=1 Tax=Polymorphum gilvum (strain LMG 25793 / CGMCC 1.9160 / SL003B-26A1) TaxID=991905 RepID=F2J4E5_POLGS|nr:agmatinase [Polymorphum gilvum]ADZ71087.1 Agmatinase, putative [Polymorphum gilvum SL003B-26A1]
MSPIRPRPTDEAIHKKQLKGGAHEPTYGGVLSFMRRRYTRDLAGVDAAVWGIPFDASVSNRPGARFGPQGVRRASAIFDGDPQYPFHTDPFEHLAVVDYGDCSFDYGRHTEIPGQIEAQAREILDAGVHLFSIGGDHFVTYPLLRAHAARFGPLALVQFDAHQDTWNDEGDRIDHGTFVGRAVREGLIDPYRSIQIGIRTHAPETCGLEIVFGEEVHDLGVAGVVARIRHRVGDAPAYMTFDIDCLDPAFAPGTGTPVAGGLSSREALMILRRLGTVGFVGGDVVEVAPAYDHADITSIAGATIAQHYLGLLAERKGKA